MNELEVKEIDGQGRIVIPQEWRKRLKTRKVVMRLKGGSIQITGFRQEDLTRYFDIGTVDVDASLDDWHAVRREVRRGRR